MKYRRMYFTPPVLTDWKEIKITSTGVNMRRHFAAHMSFQKYEFLVERPLNELDTIELFAQCDCSVSNYYQTISLCSL